MPSSFEFTPVGACAKLCYDPPEVAVVGLLYIWLTGIAQLDMAVCHALGGVFQASLTPCSAELLYMLGLG